LTRIVLCSFFAVTIGCGEPGALPKASGTAPPVVGGGSPTPKKPGSKTTENKPTQDLKPL
jgi:hypothetical protein